MNQARLYSSTKESRVQLDAFSTTSSRALLMLSSRSMKTCKASIHCSCLVLQNALTFEEEPSQNFFNKISTCTDLQVFTTAKFKACEQQWECIAGGYLSFNIIAQPLYFPKILLAPS